MFPEYLFIVATYSANHKMTALIMTFTVIYIGYRPDVVAVGCLKVSSLIRETEES